MSIDFITETLLQYRYWILIPLSLIEGPVVAFVAGTLAAVGYFNIYILAALFFVRDVGMDIGYYLTGYFGGRTAFAKRMLKKVGVTEDHLEEVRVLWERRPGWTMFVGKLSYGIAAAFIVVAGMVKMPFRLFIKYGILVAILQYGVLLLAGYFIGVSAGGSVAKIIENVGYVLAIATLIISAYYLLTRRARNKFLNKENQALQ